MDREENNGTGWQMNRRILRVFPRATSMTPIDDLVAIGEPTLFEPRKDVEEVHISVLFTWDKKRTRQLERMWADYYPVVKVGGPAYGIDLVSSEPDDFILGRYIRKGATITTRGCEFQCPWCLVPRKEMWFRQLEKVAVGNIIQDNNILLANRWHLEKVFYMLTNQKAVRFADGLDCRLLKDWHVERLRMLSIYEIWIALDCKRRMRAFQRACVKLHNAGFRRNQIRAYILAGYKEPIQAAEERLVFAWECGALPYIQVYQDESGEKRMAGEGCREDNLFVRRWSRPAIIKKEMTSR